MLELSSYQCSDLTDSPRVAVVTSLFPEHLDAHGGEREYYRDKLNLLAHGPQTIVVNGADPRLAARAGRPLPAVRAGRRRTPPTSPPAPTARSGSTSATSRSSRARCCRWSAGTTRATSVSRSPCSTRSASTWWPARTASPSRSPSSRGWPHRLTEIADPSGLTFVDDTLATSPYAAMHAIDAYEGRPLTVIVGGTDRGLDYTPLRRAPGRAGARP